MRKTGSTHSCSIAILAAVALVAGAGCRTGKGIAVDPAKLPVPIYVCPRTPLPPEIDGNIDDEIWERVPSMDEFTCFGAQTTRPTLRTNTRMCWDDRNLYVAFACLDIELDSPPEERDASPLKSEFVEVSVHAGKSDMPVRAVRLTPRNTIVDLSIRKTGKTDAAGNDICDEDTAWNIPPGLTSAVTVKGTLTDHTDQDLGWIAEIAIPLHAFADTASIPPRPGDRWHIQLLRIDHSPRLGQSESSTWSPTDSPYNTERFGTVVFGWLPEGTSSTP